jgi:hypothetical protein
MRFSLASTLVVSLAAQATANSWFGKTGAYSEVPLSCVPFAAQLLDDSPQGLSRAALCTLPACLRRQLISYSSLRQVA